MAILGLVVRDGIPEAAPLARSLFDWAAKHGHEVRIASDAPDDLLQVGSEVSREELVALSLIHI